MVSSRTIYMEEPMIRTKRPMIKRKRQTFTIKGKSKQNKRVRNLHGQICLTSDFNDVMDHKKITSEPDSSGTPGAGDSILENFYRNR